MCVDGGDLRKSVGRSEDSKTGGSAVAIKDMLVWSYSDACRQRSLGLLTPSGLLRNNTGVSSESFL